MHGLVRSTYWGWRGFRARLGGTGLQERYWATRHQRGGSDWGSTSAAGADQWAREYWESRDHPHRALLADAIARWEPASVLEFGCNCGPNLYRLAERLPDARLIGIDINEDAVEYGRTLMAAAGVSHVALTCGSVEALEAIATKSVDVVFTDAVLLYIGPDRIASVLQHLRRIAHKAVVLTEWHCATSERDILGIYDSGCWRRDYAKLLRVGDAAIADIHLTKIPESAWPSEKWRLWGYVIEAEL